MCIEQKKSVKEILLMFCKMNVCIADKSINRMYYQDCTH